MWYYTIFYCKLQYSVAVKILLMQNLIDKKNPLLVWFGMVKSLNVALDSVSSSDISSLKLHCKKFGKNILFKTVPGNFTS